MANNFKGVVKLTESQYNKLLDDGYITVGETTVEFDSNTLYVTDYMDNELVLPTNIVTTDEGQTIIALKNFTGGLTKNGFEVATLNDIPPVIDTLEPDKTQVNVSTSSLSVNQGMILDEKIKNMINTLNGQNASFTFETLADLLAAFGKSDLLGDEAADSYLVDTNKITYNGKEKTLHNGDVFWIIDSSVADYWYSSDNKTIYKLETQKVDLAEYAKLSDLSNLATNSSLADYAKKTDLSDYATNASLAAYAKLTDLTNYAKTSDLTAYAKTSEVSDKYLSKEDFANWADNAKPADNVVITDENSTQTIKGFKTFEKTVESGASTLTSKSGFTNIRKAANDNNNIHQAELYVEDNGEVKLTHRNRSANASSADAYISFDATKIKYGTGKSSGTQANNEYDILTADNFQDSIVLGVNNLVEGSLTASKAGWTSVGWQAGMYVRTIDNEYIYRFYQKDGWGVHAYALPNLIDEYVTISGDVKIETSGFYGSTNTSPLDFKVFNGATVEFDNSGESLAVLSDNEWHHFSSKPFINKGNVGFYIRAVDGDTPTGGADVHVKNLKIERGKLKTGWMPNFKDLPSKYMTLDTEQTVNVTGKKIFKQSLTISDVNLISYLHLGEIDGDYMQLYFHTMSSGAKIKMKLDSVNYTLNIPTRENGELALRQDFTPDLLWTNPDPSAQFADQIIKITNSSAGIYLSAYWLIMIEYMTKYSDDYPAKKIAFVTMDNSTLLEYCVPYNPGSYCASRTVIVSNGGNIRFYDAYYSAGNTNNAKNNTLLIPYRILGYKKIYANNNFD